MTRIDRITLDVGTVTTREELHGLLAQALGFSDYYGKNWDAFWDCVRDPEQSSMPGSFVVRNLAVLRERLPDEARLLEECLHDWAQSENGGSLSIEAPLRASQHPGIDATSAAPSLVEAEARRTAAVFASRCLDGTLDLEVFLSQFGQSTDPLIRAVADALIFRPRERFMGLTDPYREQAYRATVHGLISELEKGEQGIAPQERPYPAVSRGEIVGWAVIGLVAAAGAAEHGWKTWRLLREELDFPIWRLLAHTFALAVLSACATATFRSVWVRVLLYRSRRYDTP